MASIDKKYYHQYFQNEGLNQNYFPYEPFNSLCADIKIIPHNLSEPPNNFIV